MGVGFECDFGHIGPAADLSDPALRVAGTDVFVDAVAVL